ncbi:MAG: hypothetical protein OXN21_13615 [Chloroflexota bacterium]|nr:hypothetical protein [Chloroflexota bacterium]
MVRWTPDQLPEDLLRALNVLRGDCRKVSLEEFPISEILKRAENVRLEEIGFLVPDGRSITALMNVTSIRSEEDELENRRWSPSRT